MQYKWLVGLLLIGGVLVPVHEQIVGIQNDQDSYEVTEPQNHVQIPRPVNVARPPDSTAEVRNCSRHHWVPRTTI